MEHLTQADCDRIAAKLNRRPRKRLGFRTPEEVYVPSASVLHFKVDFTVRHPARALPVRWISVVRFAVMESEVLRLHVIMVTMMIFFYFFFLAFPLSFLLMLIALSFTVIFFLLLNPQPASGLSAVSAKPSSLTIISREYQLNVAK